MQDRRTQLCAQNLQRTRKDTNSWPHFPSQHTPRVIHLEPLGKSTSRQRSKRLLCYYRSHSTPLAQTNRTPWRTKRKAASTNVNRNDKTNQYHPLHGMYPWKNDRKNLISHPLNAENISLNLSTPTSQVLFRSKVTTVVNIG